MTNLLLKAKTELFKWLQQQLCNGDEIERDTGSDSGGEF